MFSFLYNQLNKLYNPTPKPVRFLEKIYNLLAKDMLENGQKSLLLVTAEALCPSKQLFSQIGTFSKIEPVLRYKDKVSRSRT